MAYRAVYNCENSKDLVVNRFQLDKELSDLKGLQFLILAITGTTTNSVPTKRRDQVSRI